LEGGDRSLFLGIITPLAYRSRGKPRKMSVGIRPAGIPVDIRYLTDTSQQRQIARHILAEIHLGMLN